MDPTIVVAAAGVAGVIIGAIIGGVFALKAAKRQIEVMVVQSRGNVNERLYNHITLALCYGSISQPAWLGMLTTCFVFLEASGHKIADKPDA